jgi:hypothetical protein
MPSWPTRRRSSCTRLAASSSTAICAQRTVTNFGGATECLFQTMPEIAQSFWSLSLEVQQLSRLSVSHEQRTVISQTIFARPVIVEATDRWILIQKPLVCECMTGMPISRPSECVSAFTEELLGHSVERVHFKLDVRRRAQKHPYHWLLRNRTFRGKYRASEKVASQRADF